MAIQNRGFEVSPLSAKQIKNAAKAIRIIALNKGFIGQHGEIDVVGLLEHGLYALSLSNTNAISYEIVEDTDLPDAEAKTFPDKTILIRESVYNKAAEGDGRSRFTIAHEIFHSLAHCNQISLCRASTFQTPAYKDSEWQANTFAGNLLFPDELVEKYENYSDEDVALYLGISVSCVRVRRMQYHKN